MGGWWVHRVLETGGTVLLVSWALWVIGSIVLHELAHGWAAIRCGDPTPVLTGHMTWNPLVHMGQTSLIVFAIFGIAWGLMPVDPSRLRRRHDDALVAFAGPAMNISLAMVAIAAGGVLAVYAPAAPFWSNLSLFFYYGALLNIVLAILNLMPILPLDGGRILSSFIPAYSRAFDNEQGRLVALVAFVGLFYFGGRYLFPFAGRIAQHGISAVAQLLA